MGFKKNAPEPLFVDNGASIPVPDGKLVECVSVVEFAGQEYVNVVLTDKVWMTKELATVRVER
jgi:hypothetical protein